MRDLDRRLPRRVVGRESIEKGMRLLLLRLHRFGRYRAKTAHDVLWTNAAIDALDGLLSVRQSHADVTGAEGSSSSGATAKTVQPSAVRGREISTGVCDDAGRAAPRSGCPGSETSW